MPKNSPTIRILGMMTGTSTDGLDGACIEIGPKSWKPLWSFQRPYPTELRKRVLAIQLPGTRSSLQHVLELNRDLGDWYASCARSAISTRAPSARPHVIANHGQTLAHFPAPGARGCTLQSGDPTRIAERTGLTVIAGFRDGDMAAGGEGAPLLPLFHQWIARSLLAGSRGVSLHNFGGVSNLTYVPPKGRLLAFDTGPANYWIDAAVEEITRGKKSFDRDGKLGREGEIDWNAVERALKHPYFAKPAPKSTGRDDFPYSYFRKLTRARGADLVATATAVTTESVARAYERFILKKKMPLERILICGGGARNSTLISALSQRLAPVRVEPISAIGLDSQLIEAQGFAYFAFLALQGKAVGGHWTGVERWAPPAHVIPGESKQWLELVDRIRSFRS